MSTWWSWKIRRNVECKSSLKSCVLFSGFHALKRLHFPFIRSSTLKRASDEPSKSLKRKSFQYLNCSVNTKQHRQHQPSGWNTIWLEFVPYERERERKLATSIININISYQKTENTIFPIFTHSDCLSSAPNGTAWCILIKTDWAKNNFVKNSESSKRFKRTSESDGMHTDNLSCYEMKLTFGGNHINLISFSLLKGFTTNWKIVFGFRRVRAVCLWCLSVAFDAVSMTLLCANCKQRLE